MIIAVGEETKAWERLCRCWMNVLLDWQPQDSADTAVRSPETTETTFSRPSGGHGGSQTPDFLHFAFSLMQFLGIKVTDGVILFEGKLEDQGARSCLKSYFCN